MTWLNPSGEVPISIGMTLFPSVLRSDRPTTMGAPLHPLLGLRNLVVRILALRPRTVRSLSVVAGGIDASVPERAEPRLRWTDPNTSPEGDFSAAAIPNAELGVTDVPGRTDSWDTVSDFALSYDGHGYWADLPSLAGRVLQGWTRRRCLPDTLDELRGCLFYEQRRWHHFGEEPTGRSAEYMRALVDAVAALALPVSAPAPALHGVPAARRAIASETHVKVLTASAGALRRVPTVAPVPRPVPARQGRLVPVPAAEAHVRLVSSIEEEADALSRHPSRWAPSPATGHRSADSSLRPARPGTARDLKPMPSAEPLPKPSVIEPRAGRVSTTSRGAALRPTPRRSEARRPADTARWSRSNAGARPQGSSATAAMPATTAAPVRTAALVRTMCHEFSPEQPGYAAWTETHPEAFVISLRRGAGAKTPTLHRVGCPAVAPRPASLAATTGSVRVCAPSAATLAAWSEARGLGGPTPCRRCHP